MADAQLPVTSTYQHRIRFIARGKLGGHDQVHKLSEELGSRVIGEVLRVEHPRDFRTAGPGKHVISQAVIQGTAYPETY